MDVDAEDDVAGATPLQTLSLPGLPTGVVLGEEGRLVVALDDGLHVVDPDTGSIELLSTYPEGLGVCRVHRRPDRWRRDHVARCRRAPGRGRLRLPWATEPRVRL